LGKIPHRKPLRAGSTEQISSTTRRRLALGNHAHGRPRGSLPHIFTGPRLGWGIALIVIVAAEMIGTVRGIGYMVLESQQTFRIPRVFGAIVVIGALGFVTDLGFRRLRGHMMPWYREARD